MPIRPATRDDYELLGEVMFDAVRNGASPYDEAQRRAWVGEPRRGEAWIARLEGQRILVEETGGRILGFMSLRSDGYLDFAYIRPEARGAGLFRRLFDAVLREARRLSLSRLRTHASLMAQPAFGAVGFRIVRREEVALGGEVLARFEMERALGPDGPTGS